MEQENTVKQTADLPLQVDKALVGDLSQEQQIMELKQVAHTLIQSVQAVQTQAARNAKFDDTMADLKATARAMMVSPALPQLYAHPTVEKCGCKEESQGCVSNDCCCFDIVMTHVRVLAMQPLELDDSNANPWGEMEVKMFAYLDGGIGAVIPSMFSNLTLRKLIQHPGLKVSVNRVIGNVCLTKGKSKIITIGVDAIEDDAGLIERATGGRDEEGSNSVTMSLDCCCTSPITATMDIFFTSGGQGGGAIEVGFTAVRKN